MSDLEVKIEHTGAQTRIELVGELDIASAERFEEELLGAERDPATTLVLDLRGVEFIDSTGLRAVIAAHERAQAEGRRLVIVRGAMAVERVLSLTQLDERLDLVDDPDSISA
jgi:anti-sigma B factor antagonist